MTAGITQQLLGSVKNAIINFSMAEDRGAAWSLAETLSPSSEDQQNKEIADKVQMLVKFSTVTPKE